MLKYRHYLYDWLSVDKVELAVMTELLLRGAQTVGELRGRAARMEPIADLAALKPVLDSLRAKGLVISLSPEGRGQVVSHALYQPQELEKVRREQSAAPMSEQGESHPSASYAAPSAATTADAEQLADLRAEDATLRREVEGLAAELRRQGAEFERFRASVGG